MTVLCGREGFVFIGSATSLHIPQMRILRFVSDSYISFLFLSLWPVIC